MKLIVCLKTSVTDYQSMLCNIPEKRRSNKDVLAYDTDRLHQMCASLSFMEMLTQVQQMPH